MTTSYVVCGQTAQYLQVDSGTGNPIAWHPLSGAPLTSANTYYGFRMAYTDSPSTWFTPLTGAVEVGAACGSSANWVAMSRTDYDALRSHTSGVTTGDVALLTTAVMLVWAVAWLSKRAVRVLIPNG